jgi:hypothetical protein
MNATPLLLGVGAYALITLLQKKADATKLVFTVAGVDASADGITPILNVKLGIENASDSKYLIKSIVGNLSANGSNIGNVATYQEIYINPRSSSYYVLPIRLSLIGIALDIYNYLSGSGSLSQELVFAGSANVDGYIASINLKYKIG